MVSKIYLFNFYIIMHSIHQRVIFNNINDNNWLLKKKSLNHTFKILNPLKMDSIFVIFFSL